MPNKIQWLSNNLNFLCAVLISILLHAIVLFGLNFGFDKKHKDSYPVLQVVIKNKSLKIQTSDSAHQHDYSFPQPKSDTKSSSAENAGLPLKMPILNDRYYEAKELDSPLLKPIDEVSLNYPKDALNGNIKGTVKLELFINEYGEVVSLDVVDATMPGIFDQAAVDAFRDLKFTPGLRNGLPVKARIKIVVSFGEDF